MTFNNNLKISLILSFFLISTFVLGQNGLLNVIKDDIEITNNLYGYFLTQSDVSSIVVNKEKYNFFSKKEYKIAEAKYLNNKIKEIATYNLRGEHFKVIFEYHGDTMIFINHYLFGNDRVKYSIEIFDSSLKVERIIKDKVEESKFIFLNNEKTRIDSIYYPFNNLTIYHSYNERGMLMAVNIIDDSSNILLKKNEYDNQSRIIKRILPQDSILETYTYPDGSRNFTKQVYRNERLSLKLEYNYFDNNDYYITYKYYKGNNQIDYVRRYWYKLGSDGKYKSISFSNPNRGKFEWKETYEYKQ
jgi:hypothetical protein